MIIPDCIFCRRTRFVALSAVALGVLFLQGMVYGQTKNISDYEVRRLSIYDGLASQVVTAVCTDASGIMWIGTSQGLFRFDGFRVDRFEASNNTQKPLSENVVTGLEADTLYGNLLFVSTQSGTRVIDPESGHYLPDSSIGLPAGFLEQCLQIEKSSGGFYWLLTKNTIYKLFITGKNQCRYQYAYPLPECLNPKICADPADPEGLWVLPAEMALYYLNINREQQIMIPDCPGNPSPVAGLIDLVSTDQGIIGWDLARNVYLLQADRKALQLLQPPQSLYSFFPLLAGVDNFIQQKPHVKCFLQLWAGQQVFGTSLGLSIVRKKLIGFRVIEPMRGEEIRGIHTDQTGQWWAGTYNGMYSGNLYRPGLKKFECRPVWDFLHLYGQYYLLALENKKGLGFWDVSAQQCLPESSWPDMDSSSAQILSALSITKDTEGTIWVGTYYSLFFANAGLPRHFELFKGLSGNKDSFLNIRVLMPDPQTGVWAGTESGLYRIVFNQEKQTYEILNGKPLFPGVPISDLYRDKRQRLWIGTKGKGLACLNLNDADLPVQWYNSSQGLCHDMVSRIEGSHNDDVLWISTHNGLSRFDPAELVFHNFYEDSGFPGNEFNSGASARFSDGTLLFGGVSGLIAFHPDSIPSSNFRHKTILTVARVYDQESHSLRTLHLSPAVGITLPSYPEYLEFQLGSTEYISPANARFRYRLHGLSELWTYTSGEREVKFIRLAPGSYNFEVQAIPLEGQFGNPVFLPIFILTPFYETWWFRVLLLLGIILIAYLAYWYRLQQILYEHQIRRQIADDLHDDIGNKLNFIVILAQKISKNTPQTPELTKLIEVSRNAMRSLHTMIWSVDSKKDRFSSLVTRMQDFADSYLRPIGIQFRFEVPQPIPNRNIDLKARHHTILIYQELLTNMAKYTHPGLVQIRVNLLQDTLSIQIINQHKISSERSDSGISANRGLGSIERRLNRINGHLLWTETSPTQQEILLTVPKIFKHS